MGWLPPYASIQQLKCKGLSQQFNLKQGAVIMSSNTCEYGMDSGEFVTSPRHRLQVANVQVRLFQTSLMVFALTWYFFAIRPLCPFNNFDVLKQEQQSVGVCRLTLCAYISMARSGVKTILPCFEIGCDSGELCVDMVCLAKLLPTDLK
jgi:hypothetical protein